MTSSRYPLALAAVFLAAGAVSAWRPCDWINWISETFPAWIGAGVIAATHRRWPLTPVSQTLCCLFALILFTGGHYTYALVPAGEWMKEWFGFERNHFDRLGHFFQGVIPAMVVRERLLRLSPLRNGPRVFFLATGAALAISALYEIFEWQYAVWVGGDQASDFLGSQGDIWDAQQDMTMALLGAMTSQLLLGSLHARQITAGPAWAPSAPPDSSPGSRPHG